MPGLPPCGAGRDGQGPAHVDPRRHLGSRARQPAAAQPHRIRQHGRAFPIRGRTDRPSSWSDWQSTGSAGPSPIGVARPPRWLGPAKPTRSPPASPSRSCCTAVSWSTRHRQDAHRARRPSRRWWPSRLLTASPPDRDPLAGGNRFSPRHAVDCGGRPSTMLPGRRSAIHHLSRRRPAEGVGHRSQVRAGREQPGEAVPEADGKGVAPLGDAPSRR